MHMFQELWLTFFLLLQGTKDTMEARFCWNPASPSRSRRRSTDPPVVVLRQCPRSDLTMAAATAPAVMPTASMAALPTSARAARASSLSGPLLPALPGGLRNRQALYSAPPMAASSFSAKGNRRSGVCVRATTSEETTVPDAQKQLQELFEELKQKYDALENKSQVWIYGGGALVALWVSSIIVGAVNSIPVLPKVLEFVGLCYSGWFVYRYLLFKSSRKQLADDIEELKLKITGTTKSAFPVEDDK